MLLKLCRNWCHQAAIIAIAQIGVFWHCDYLGLRSWLQIVHNMCLESLFLVIILSKYVFCIFQCFFPFHLVSGGMVLKGTALLVPWVRTCFAADLMGWSVWREFLVKIIYCWRIFSYREMVGQCLLYFPSFGFQLMACPLFLFSFLLLFVFILNFVYMELSNAKT